MSIFARRQPEEPMSSDDLEPSPAIAKRLADLKADDLRTYADTGGDLDLWPDGWNDPASDWFIKPLDRRTYWRSLADDLAMMRAMREQAARAGRNGSYVTPITREEADRVCHRTALRRAVAERKHAEQLAQEARLDASARHCDSCGTSGDSSVKPRHLPGVIKSSPLFGWRLCDPCAPVVELNLRTLLDQRTNALAEQTTPNGQTRGELAARFAERLIA